MTPSIFSFTQKTRQAGAVTESRPVADSGALPAPGAFAERLQQQLQAPPPPQAPRPAAHQEPVSSSQDPAPQEPDAATRQARRGAAPQRPRAAAPPAQHRAEAPSADRAAAAAKPAASEAAEDDTEGSAEATTPGARRGRGADASADAPTPLNLMLQWMAAKPPADAAGAGGPLLQRAGAADTALARAGKGLGHAGAGAGRLTPDEATGQAAGTAPAGTGEAWRAALAAEGRVAGHALAQDHPLAAASGTPAAAAWAPVAGAGGLPDAPAPVQVSLDTPVNRPEFRDELAAQVSSFAHDGIQEAVLTLNPAEMGPITVQIVLDGTQATVDFQALQPATRELIEASLPALASALHGEGLTLSGGSVGDQRAPSQGDQDARGGRQGLADADPMGSTPVRAAARRTEGVLDLYA